MKTIVQVIKSTTPTKEDLVTAAGILQNGGLVAFPTETVYGLGGDALNPLAAQKIYAAKGRPSDNPLIVHIADVSALSLLTREVPEKGRILAEKFWPGPLTMIFKKSDLVPPSTTGGLDTVAIRMPSHPVAQALISVSGVFVAAPSANTSGRPSPTKASHVIEDLEGKIDMILDGGTVGIGIESTIVDMTCEPPIILRPGSITEQMLTEAIGPVAVDKALLSPPTKDAPPKAPGMKYKHYAPKGDLIIYEGESASVSSHIKKRARWELSLGKSVGIIATSESFEDYQSFLEGNLPLESPLTGSWVIKNIGSRKDEATIAHSLYNILREFDTLGTQLILSEDFSEGALGTAIMNRLLKAAGYQMIHLKKGDIFYE
jgi:L-threonylcarbamoyladenylate synthase